MAQHFHLATKLLIKYKTLGTVEGSGNAPGLFERFVPPVFPLTTVPT